MATMVQDNSGLMNGTRSPDGKYVQHSNVQKSGTIWSLTFSFHQLLCADPSPLKIPALPSYLHSELPKSTSSTAPQAPSQDHLADRLSWLFPEEVQTILGKETEDIDWEKGIEILLQKADMISADEGGMEEGNKKLSSAPLGLKNRWRIWKILQGIRLLA